MLFQIAFASLLLALQSDHTHSPFSATQSVDLAQILGQFLSNYQSEASKHPESVDRRHPVIEAMRIRLLDLRLASNISKTVILHDQCDGFIDLGLVNRSLSDPARSALRLHHVGDESIARFEQMIRKSSKDLRKIEREFVKCMEAKYMAPAKALSARLDLKNILLSK